MIYDGPDFIGPMRKLGPILALLDYVAELLRLHNDAEDAAKERALTGSIGLM